MWGISHSLLLATCNHSSAVQAVLHGAEGQFLFSYAVETAEAILLTCVILYEEVRMCRLI